jgi:hypothetical protein
LRSEHLGNAAHAGPAVHVVDPQCKFSHELPRCVR